MRNINRETLIEELLALRPELEREGVVHAALFGSRARRDNRADSDVDLLIDVKQPQEFSLLDLIGVGHTIEDRIGLPTSIVVRQGLDEEFHDEVARDQVLVF